MKKTQFNLDEHPKFGNRKPDLEPNQKGLLTIRKDYLEKKKLGEDYEKRLCELLRNAFPNDIILHNTIFESGKYIDSLKIYESLQMDILLISVEGIFCIEAKWISDEKYSRLSGGASANSWTLKTKRGTNNREINGTKQNYRHIQFLEELFEKEDIKCPIYRITVIGGLDRKKIVAQQFLEDNLVDTDELVDRVNYLKMRFMKMNEGKTDVKYIKHVLDEWKSNVPGIETLHVVYARNIRKKRLPSRCKKVMRSL